MVGGELIVGDNLDYLRRMNDGVIDLIYLDPPFNSGRDYTAVEGSLASQSGFTDRWNKSPAVYAGGNHDRFWPRGLYDFIVSAGNIHGESMKNYLFFMSLRIIEFRRVLSSSGSMYVHCDGSASHYLRVIMDSVLGSKNFQNEIVWCYGGRGMAKNRFQRKHDTILFYGKGDDRFFNRSGASRPVEAKYAGRYDKLDSRGNRYANIKNRDGSYSQVYLKDVVREDWWVVPFVRGDERTGYPTQKPIALLDRIIESSTSPGQVVLDPFCGSGTTMVSSERLGRRWIGLDISSDAINVCRHRLVGLGVSFAAQDGATSGAVL